MDKRTKRQKLQAMANQTVSPNEAKAAKTFLETLPPETLDHSKVLFVLQIHFNGSTVIYTVGE